MTSPARPLALACVLLVACSSTWAQGNTVLAELPITLIDGETLIELLIEHRIGVRKRKLELWELDTDALSAEADSEVDHVQV